MIPVCHGLSEFLARMSNLPARGRYEGHYGGRRACVLIHDTQRDLALVCYRVRWDPLMEIMCGTIEQDVDKHEMRRLSPQPFLSLVDSPLVQWLPDHPRVVRTGLLPINDEKEIMSQLEDLRDWKPYYAWLTRAVLREMLTTDMRMSEGFTRASSSLAFHLQPT